MRIQASVKRGQIRAKRASDCQCVGSWVALRAVDESGAEINIEMSRQQAQSLAESLQEAAKP